MIANLCQDQVFNTTGRPLFNLIYAASRQATHRAQPDQRRMSAMLERGQYDRAMCVEWFREVPLDLIDWTVAPGDKTVMTALSSWFPIGWVGIIGCWKGRNETYRATGPTSRPDIRFDGPKRVVRHGPDVPGTLTLLGKSTDGKTRDDSARNVVGQYFASIDFVRLDGRG